ncbi:MAG: polyprenyl synthetase family protein [Firmicutes bacterium]|nr:polyprenyl synthetase family protein [Bacillota bacterium]
MKTILDLKKHGILPRFYGMIGEPLIQTEEYIRTLFRSDNKEIEEAAIYLLDSGGKRLRPGLLLLSGHCGTYNEEKLIPMAAAVEIIHMASLVHDDIVDDTPLRRGKPTIAKAKGKQTALLTGNFMLTKALGAVLSMEDDTIRTIALKTAQEMCRGEFSQLEARKTPDFSAEHYLLRVKRKTANLISAACAIGAHASGAEEATICAMEKFGENIGIAFQITDDILDYTANTHQFGKAIGSDIIEGLATMPLICAWQKGNEKEMMAELFRKGKDSEKAVKDLISLVEENEGTKEAAEIAASYIEDAKECLSVIENKEIRDAFTEIADFIIARKL